MELLGVLGFAVVAAAGATDLAFAAAGLVLSTVFLAGAAPAHAMITGALVVAATCVLCAIVVLALPTAERNTAA